MRTDGAGAGSGDEVPEDRAFELLADRRRRLVVALLATRGRPLTVNDLAKEIVVREHDTRIRDVPGETLSRLSAALHHCHLPKLAEYGVVSYDRDRHLAEPTPALETVERYLPPEVKETARDDAYSDP